MKKLDFKNGVSRAFHTVGFKVKKHSPEILVISGIVGVVTSAVLACRATTKLGDILEKDKKQVESIKEYADVPDHLSEKYTKEDSIKDIKIVHRKTALDVAKLYAPSVTLGLLSITGILAGNNILHKRNVALAAAYTTVDSSFKNYRNNVIERFGNELDKELKYNIKTKENDEVVVGKNGEEKIVKKNIKTAEIDERSEYARIYDDGCTGWQKDPEHNLWQLKILQSWANDKLKAQGYLFLNDVYESLNIPKTKAGQVVGWSLKKGDGYVDFGIYDIHDEKKRDFVNGYERNIILDFNVDGYILDLI